MKKSNLPIYTVSKMSKVPIRVRLELFRFNLKNFVQRGLNGYSERDLRNFDKYLVHILTYGMREAQKFDYCFPHEFIKLFATPKMADDYWKVGLEEVSQHFYNSMPDNAQEIRPNRYETAARLALLHGKFEHPVVKKYFEEAEKIRDWQEEERYIGFELLYSLMTGE
jgi:hypothetical protein